jgi:hypothetical protein
MANDVFANGREISCKKADGKSICAFPDVCFTPPECPATPPGIPIPYPNTGFAKDTTKGSKKVKISGKEIMLKNKSHFKKSTGDEAGRTKKKGLITSKIKGKVYFTAWSMDVKVEGKNVVRHLDLTTHNHGSQPGNSPPWPYVDSIAVVTIPGKGSPEKCPTCKTSKGKSKSDGKPYNEFFSDSERAAFDKIASNNPNLVAMLPPKDGIFKVISKRDNDKARSRYRAHRKKAGMTGSGDDLHHPHSIKTGGCPIHQELVKKPNKEPEKTRVQEIDDEINRITNLAISRNS